MAIDHPLVLHRRMRAPDPASLHCREIELRLDEDGRHLVLSRYTELYREERTAWCSISHHHIPLVSVIRWMIENGTP